MRSGARHAAILALGLAVTIGGSATFATAQDAGRPVVPPGWHVRHVHIVQHRDHSAAQVAGERSLTVRKPFAPEDDGIFSEGGTVYGDVAAYVPEPRIDSGVQFPYGFDGVGGYGSDIGFSAGHDADIYDRGALDQPQPLRLGGR